MSVQQVVIRADNDDGPVRMRTCETAGFESLAGVYERMRAAVDALAALFPDAAVIDVRITRDDKW